MTPPTTLHFLSDGSIATLFHKPASLQEKKHAGAWHYRYTVAREKLGMEFTMDADRIQKLIAFGNLKIE